MKSKTLDNIDIAIAKAKIPDLKVFGDGDTFRLICKASSEQEGWSKSCKAMEIPNCGCVINVSTQQIDANGCNSIAEALVFVPEVHIHTVYSPTGDVVDIRIKKT